MQSITWFVQSTGEGELKGKSQVKTIMLPSNKQEPSWGKNSESNENSVSLSRTTVHDVLYQEINYEIRDNYSAKTCGGSYVLHKH